MMVGTHISCKVNLTLVLLQEISESSGGITGVVDTATLATMQVFQTLGQEVGGATVASVTTLGSDFPNKDTHGLCIVIIPKKTQNAGTDLVLT